MEAGLKEVAAALVAAVVFTALADFLYTSATTGGWFSGKLFAGVTGATLTPMLPGTAASGGIAPGGAPTAIAALPAPTTC